MKKPAIKKIRLRTSAPTYVVRYDEQIRNICWNCDKYFAIHIARYYEPIEEGQKVYLKCNHCGKVNHL